MALRHALALLSGLFHGCSTSAAAHSIDQLDGVPRCPDAPPPATLTGTIVLQPWAGADVSVTTATAAAEAAAHPWREDGLTVQISPPRRLTTHTVLGGSPEQITDALTDAARASEEPLTDHARLAVTAAVTLGDLQALQHHLVQYAAPNTVQIVTLDRLTHPTAAIDTWATVDALTLTPGTAPSADPADLLRLAPPPAGSAPLVLLAAHPARRPSDPPLTPAHELGHALGLTHHTSSGNRLRPGRAPCLTGIDADQAAQVQRWVNAHATEATTASPASPSPSPPE